MAAKQNNKDSSPKLWPGFAHRSALALMKLLRSKLAAVEALVTEQMNFLPKFDNSGDSGSSGLMC